MPDLTVTLIQTALHWENINANLGMLDTTIDKIGQPTDLIVLPEMFSTGFTMAAEQLAEPMTGKTVSWLRAKSAACGAAITGSLIVRADHRFFNRLVCCQPDGGLVIYDKKHLFSFAGEEKVFTAGNAHADVIIKGWRVRPFICYDLRFPVWTCNLGPAYDLALFVANWPAARSTHWQVLLKARAIENQAYVVGVNRVGRDGYGHEYSGASLTVSPRGHILADAGHQECARTLTLDRAALETYRETFPAWRDADQDLGMILNNR